MIPPPYLADLYTNNPVDWNVCKERLRKALREHPEDKISIFHLQRLTYYMQEKYSDCLRMCRKLLPLETDPQELEELYMTMGICYEEKKQPDLAIEHYLKSGDVYEHGGEGLDRLGQLYIDHFQYEKAQEVYERLLNTKENWKTEALNNLGYLHQLKREFDKALEYYKMAADLEPEQDCWVGEVGKQYYNLKQYDLAEEWFRKQLVLNPTSEDAYYGIGSCMQEKGDFYRAMHNFSEVLKLNPKHFRSLNNLGKLYFDHEGDVKKAIEMIEQAIEYGKDDDSNPLSVAYLNLKRIYQLISDEEKSDYYKVKFIESMGFEVGYEDTDEGDEDFPGEEV
jgi:tetratricopeptide (TPR) repeat protein